MDVRFSKIHGLGNDFIVVSELDGPVVREEDRAGFARRFCQRRVSVGSDGVLFLQPPSGPGTDFRMRMFNPDGSEAENCVNGLRCAGYEYMRKRGKADMTVETLAGNVRMHVSGEHAGLAMAELEFHGRLESHGKSEIKLRKGSMQCHLVDVGNPHAVIFLEQGIDGYPVRETGHEIEMHPRFSPGRVNVEFVNVKSRKWLRMRVWERGAGETMSCGTGSIAAVVAACEQGMCGKGDWVKVEQPGGTLEIRYGDGLSLKGPAELSFEGTLRTG